MCKVTFLFCLDPTSDVRTQAESLNDSLTEQRAEVSEGQGGVGGLDGHRVRKGSWRWRSEVVVDTGGWHWHRRPNVLHCMWNYSGQTYFTLDLDAVRMINAFYCICFVPLKKKKYSLL